MKNSMEFLYTNNKQVEIDLNDTIYNSIKKCKLPRIKSNKMCTECYCAEVTLLYPENWKY